MNMNDVGNTNVISALLAFKKRIINDPNGVLADWNSTNPCNWRGVLCSHGPISRVEELHLAEANLTGFLGGELGQLRYLIHLNLSANNFTGQISSEIFKLRNLTALDLSKNQMYGNIPLEPLTPLEKLAVLRLQNNMLNGSIPPELGHLRELLHLNLSANQLSGTIPKQLGQLKKLRVLDLSQNRLSGSIPFELGQLRMLRQLVLFSNNLTGRIPAEMGQLEILQAFVAYNNRLSGSIAPQLGQLKSLENLNLGNNSISSELPSELGMLENLEILELQWNNITGNIPSFLANLSRLKWLDMSANQLSGVVPSFLANCSMLKYVRLDKNMLVGELPAEIGRLMHLHSLSIATNNLTRVHPALTFSNRSSLVLIDFCFNNLKGTLPESWGQNKNLRVFTVAYNKLEGNLPDWLWDLHNLQLLDFSNNQFTGRIPAKIGSLQALRKDNNTQHVPETLWSDKIILNFKGTLLFYDYFFSTQAFLDLSGNRLSGQIPSEIGFLNCLRNLNLSANRLSGHIPRTLGNLTLLESLDLSMNLLDGQIPRELTNINGLSVLNVSYNNLSGAIPAGRQFNTFTNSSYLGNKNLYGFPLSNSNNWSSRGGDKVEHGRKLSGLAIILSVLTGAILLCVFLVCCYCFCRTRVCHSCAHENPQILSFGEGLKLNLSDLSDATNGFSEAAIIGTGAKSKVYRGVLSDSTMIAIKILQVASHESLRCFVNESEILGKIRHRNLVKLLGLFSDSKTKALVLQFMPNGSLESHLHRSDQICQLTWEARYKIATGIAQALVYLHRETGIGQIVHCDLKPSNVLLDKDMEAHVCDFGIARMLISQITEPAALSTTVKGSIGYIAPELAYGERICTKADVYSYGVMLLEIITRRSPTCQFPAGFNSLAEWVRCSLKEQNSPPNMEGVVDPFLLQTIDAGEVASAAYQYSIMEEIVAGLRLGVMCCQNDPKERPPMNVVLSMLRNIKKPARANFASATKIHPN